MLSFHSLLLRTFQTLLIQSPSRPRYKDTPWIFGRDRIKYLPTVDWLRADFIVPSFSEMSAFCTRRMTKGLLAKFKKQYGKDGMFASLSHRLHKGFEGFRDTAGKVKNEDEPQVRSESQIKEQQYRNSKHNCLFLSFLLLYIYIFF